MAVSLPDLPPSEAWTPLPDSAFDAAAARHLLRRTGWTATPAATEAALRRGLPTTVSQLFQAAAPFPEPARVAQVAAEAPDLYRRIRGAASEQERQRLRREARELGEAATRDLSIRWLCHAALPGNEAAEKLFLFLSDILVVSSEKVRNPKLLLDHHNLLRGSLRGDYPALLKAVSRSPAMIEYLDLQQSGKAHPNENFARELLELFSLGEGNYTEADIKEAARAFTGYRHRLGRFILDRQQHDTASKTVFGRSGRFDGDDVIDLIFQQPAAATFLPRELVRFYLSDQPLDPAYTDELGRFHRSTGFNLGRLTDRFFSSRAFFHPALRGSFIKSPIQYYLGLVQDLGLSVPPFPRPLNSLRQMGQRVFEPPNVRGWVGGRHWINSSTLAARRSLVEQLFTPVDESTLNADELVELVAARAEGEVRLYVDATRLQQLAGQAAGDIASRLSEFFLPRPPQPEAWRVMREFIAASTDPATRPERVRTAVVAVLQSPDYQLC